MYSTALGGGSRTWRGDCSTETSFSQSQSCARADRPNARRAEHSSRSLAEMPSPTPTCAQPTPPSRLPRLAARTARGRSSLQLSRAWKIQRCDCERPAGDELPLLEIERVLPTRIMFSPSIYDLSSRACTSIHCLRQANNPTLWTYAKRDPREDGNNGIGPEDTIVSFP